MGYPGKCVVVSGSDNGGDNTFIGINSGQSINIANVNTCVRNTAVGNNTLPLITVGSNNVAIGANALSTLDNGSGGNDNYALGVNALDSLEIGINNVAIGTSSGAAYTDAESSNILINNGGVNGENNTLRIGDQTGTGTNQLSSAYISGIRGINVPNAVATVVAVDSTSEQLGTTTITAGTGVSITPGIGTITIANSSPSSLVLLGTRSATSSGSLSFTSLITGTYNTYFVSWSLVQPATEDDALQMLISTNNGSSYLSTGYQAGFTNWSYTGANANVNSTSVIYLNFNQINTGYCSGSMWLYNLQNGGVFQGIGDSAFQSNAAVYRAEIIATNTATMVNAIRFLFPGGNMTTGNFALYGLVGS
jgi:hypothetical protein